MNKKYFKSLFIGFVILSTLVSTVTPCYAGEKTDTSFRASVIARYNKMVQTVASLSPMIYGSGNTKAILLFVTAKAYLATAGFYIRQGNLPQAEVNLNLAQYYLTQTLAAL